MKQAVKVLLAIVLSSLFTNVRSQEKHEYKEAIEDNSFLIEEAYNQEERVVQHIFNGLFQVSPSNNIFLSFTQEWPLLKYKHQVSYTIPYTFQASPSSNGIGDILLNYRYQLFYENDWACVSPRFSLILPTGDAQKGFGNGEVGFQLSIPASKRISDYWVIHLNAGSTILPCVSKSDTMNIKHRKTLASFNLGASTVWLLAKNFNLFLEVLENFNNEFNESGNTVYNNQTILNPGFRFAINLNKLQIVPGLSVPITISGNKPVYSAFLYLSFEHPY